MTKCANILQVISTFDTRLMAPTLQKRLACCGIAEVKFTSREDMTGYMVAPSWDTEQVAGTVVMVRVEDWLRDSSNSSGGTISDAWTRKELQARMRDFVSEISVLAYRGQPVWFLASSVPGWFAGNNKLSTLCRTYTNLLAVRVKNVPGITFLNWPGALSGAEASDLAADEFGNIPFTPEAFEGLAEFVSAQIERTLAQSGTGAIRSTTTGSPELAAYLAGLRVTVEIRRVSKADVCAVDRIVRTAASFSLAGEKPDICDADVVAIVSSKACLLVEVRDRMDNHGPSGVISYRQGQGSLVVETMSLSCTVLGKQVEYAVVSALAQLARVRGCSEIVFEYKPSGRNQTIQSFLQSIADPDEGTAFSVPVDEVHSRINAKAVNPGAWTLTLEAIQDGASSAVG